MGGIGAAWLAFIAAGTLRWERANPRTLPRPSIYLGAAALFSLLGVAAQSERARQPVTVLAWGLVVAQLVGGTWADALPGQSPSGQLIPVSPGNSRTDVAAIEAATAAAARRKRAGIGPTGSRVQPTR